MGLSVSDDDGTVSVRRDGDLLARYDADGEGSKPGFDTVALPAEAAKPGENLTVAAPHDHPWHLGAFFCQKLVDGINCWESEPNAAAGEPHGFAEIDEYGVEVGDGHGAEAGDDTVTIRQDATWRTDSGESLLGDSRTIRVHSPERSAGGGANATDSAASDHPGYLLTWEQEVTAVEQGGGRVVERGRLRHRIHRVLRRGPRSKSPSRTPADRHPSHPPAGPPPSPHGDPLAGPPPSPHGDPAAGPPPSPHGDPAAANPRHYYLNGPGAHHNRPIADGHRSAAPVDERSYRGCSDSTGSNPLRLPPRSRSTRRCTPVSAPSHARRLFAVPHAFEQRWIASRGCRPTNYVNDRRSSPRSDRVAAGPVAGPSFGSEAGPSFGSEAGPWFGSLQPYACNRRPVGSADVARLTRALPVASGDIGRGPAGTVFASQCL